ncbi:hypothetical protein N7582_004428 [Saccharomyces uvarum]|uniref:Uncharacterized protein n=1 Tax=Saccharomyces uvarum TaxID=230603 RepID=A0AA35J6P8_SACUV|nr:hypothetical protein N7582_004428 [Saccharomyces uvarum]CAI4048650.1 hypothetical protein SUVC_13G2580 [Saccharomyces uvarum]
MDAGFSAMAPRNGQPSARAQLRNNLLNSDIGNIDIRDETPISGQEKNSNNNSNQSFPMPQPQQQQLPQQYYRNNANEAPMSIPVQYPQMPMQMYPQQQQQQQYDFGYSDPSMNGIPVKQHNFSKPSPSNNRNNTNNRKSSSLTQSSFSNFFKHKHQFGKSKKKTKGGVGDGDDDDDVIMEDSTSADLTFNDIQTFGHKGGDKYGYGGDSAPIIPTLVTKDRGNMTNTEYRKYLTNQRKTAMSAMAKQTKTGTTDSLPPRAMSLQSFPNGNPLVQAPTPHPLFQPNNMMNPNDSRTNSLMSGPPRQFQQQLQQQRIPPMNQYNNRPGQFQNPSQPVMRPGQQQQPQQPRAMSLTNSPRYSPQNARPFVPQQQIPQRQQQPQQQIPQRQQQQPQQQQMSQNYRTMSLQAQTVPQGPNRWNPNDSDRRAIPANQPMGPSSTSSRNNSAYSIPNVKNKLPTASSSSSSSSFVDGTAVPDLTTQKSSPLRKQINNNQPIENKGKLNVLQLSAPQQNELKEKQRKLEEMENSLRERELLIEQKERARIETETKEPKETLCEEEDLNLRPTSALETGLKDLSLEGENTVANRSSLATFSSTFSDSPSKQRIFNARTGMYKLENSTDINEYVTAQEFPPPEQNDANLDNVEAKTMNESRSGYIDSNRASLLQSIPERDPKRNIPAGTIQQCQASGDVRRLSNVNISMNQENINNDTFLYRKNDRNGHLSTVSYMSGSSRRSYISNTQPLNIDPTPEPDNFMPNMDGSPSKKSATPIAKINGNDGNDDDNDDDDDDANDTNEDFSFDNTVARPYEPSYAKRESTSTVLDSGESGSQSKMITISGEQLNLITENKELMSELTLVSTELAESIKRETELEEKIRLYETNNSTPNFDDTSSVSFSDFEKELRKKSSKIVQLIQQLNDERLKRFIAEEQLLLQENGIKPSSIELVAKIENLNKLIDEKDSEIEMLKSHLQ